jgi:hypothetical protein
MMHLHMKNLNAPSWLRMKRTVRVDVAGMARRLFLATERGAEDKEAAMKELAANFVRMLEAKSDVKLKYRQRSGVQRDSEQNWIACGLRIECDRLPIIAASFDKYGHGDLTLKIHTFGGPGKYAIRRHNLEGLYSALLKAFVAVVKVKKMTLRATTLESNEYARMPPLADAVA